MYTFYIILAIIIALILAAAAYKITALVTGKKTIGVTIGLLLGIIAFLISYIMLNTEEHQRIDPANQQQAQNPNLLPQVETSLYKQNISTDNAQKLANNTLAFMEHAQSDLETWQKTNNLGAIQTQVYYPLLSQLAQWPNPINGTTAEKYLPCFIATNALSNYAITLTQPASDVNQQSVDGQLNNYQKNLARCRKVLV